MEQVIWPLRVWRSPVVRWTAAYIAAAFGALQGLSLLAELFAWPAWVSRAAAILLVWGIPVAAVVAWYHGTPGSQRIERREAALIVVFVVLAGGTVGWDLWRQMVNVVAEPVADTIAVLAFENTSGREEDAYLSDGFSDELRDQLSRVQGLRVLARTSSKAFRDRELGPAAIAETLGAALLVEGSLRKSGDRIRISVRLIDGVKGLQLWSESYDRAASDLYDVQQEIALAAAHRLLPRLSPDDVPAPQWQASVHDMMLLARSYQQNAITPADQEKVIEIYQRVIAIDAQSAPAHARLAKALLFQGTDVAAAEEHVRRALSLDPNLAEGYAVLGLVLWAQYKHGSGDAYKRAVELNPNDAEAAHLYALYLQLQFDDRAVKYWHLARNLDPMSLIYNADLAFNIALGGHVVEADEVAEQIRQRFPDAAGRYALSRIASATGELDEAVAWALESLRFDPQYTVATQDLAELYARLGMQEAARRVQPEPSVRVLFWERRYAEIVEQMEDEDLDEVDGDTLGDLAFALQALGRDAAAIPLLESMGLPELALDDDRRRLAALNHLVTFIGVLQADHQDGEARRLALWLQDLLGERGYSDGGWGSARWRACNLAVLGERDAALVEFEGAAHATNLAWLPYLLDSGCFRSLRDSPRYQEGIRVVRERHDALRKKLPLTLAKHGLTVEG